MKLLDVVIDNKDGWGQVPDNQNVDYMGIRVKMRPSIFANLATTLTTLPSDAIKDHIAKGGSIGAPFLNINVPRHFEDHATVVGHEGRNRMIAVYQVEGDAPIEVHIFFRGEVDRNRHITKEVNKYLNTGLYAERSGGVLVKGPFWEAKISEEAAGVGRITKQNTTVDVKPGETKRQAAKFGNKINKKNQPPLLLADESIDVEGFAQQLKQKYNLKDLWMNDLDRRNAIELSSIIVNRDAQKSGIGTQVMTDIVNFADEHGKIIVLNLGVKDKIHGTTSKSRLRKFYTRFGFVNNKGRNKNFEFMSAMIRNPKKSVTESQLNELFDKSYDWKWITDHFRGSFRVGRFFTSDHRRIDVDFMQKGSTNKWGIIFAINDDHTATGEGDEFRIFATVIQIIGAFIKEVEPDKLYFTAEKPTTPDTNQNSNSRSSLYTRMVKRFAGQVGMRATIDDEGDKTDFTLIKESKKSSGPTYELQLIRSQSGDVLKIKSSRQPSWVEIRGKSNYEITHDPNDPLHSFLDKLDAPTVAALMAGDTKFLNPNNPRTTPSIDMARDITTNESQLNELFDKIYDWNWTRRDKDQWAATFNKDKGEIQLTFSFHPNARRNKPYWGVAFSKLLHTGNVRTFDKTNDGDQFRIFGTVLDIMKEFFREVNPNIMVKFSAEKEDEELNTFNLESREKLYTRMIKKFATQVDRTAVVIPGLVGTRYELHPIEVTEEIKKPHPKDTLGVKREDMPQVHKSRYPELLKYLAANGGRFTTKEVDASKLKAVQSEFSDEGVEKMMRKKGVTGDGSRKPLIVSADNYIIDGHHRWLAAANMDETVLVMQINIPVKKLMQLVRDFKHTTYKTIYNESFDSAYDYEWVQQRYHWIGHFTIKDESMVKVFIHKMDMANWQRQLFAHGIKQDEFPPADEDEPIYNIDFTRDSSIELTGRGDQMAIFATIIKMITEFFNTVKPTQIVFGAEKSNAGIVGSRAKLYKRFANLFAKQTGYKSLAIDGGREAYFYIYSPSIIAEKYTAMQLAVMEGGHSLEDLEENLSIIGTKQHQEERRKKLRPGTKSWFRHWFTRSHLTRNEVDTLKEEMFTYIEGHRGVQNEKTINNRGFNND